MPQVTTNTLAGGPSIAMQTVLTQLPPPILTSQTVPPVIPGGSFPSTHTVPHVIPGGIIPSDHAIPLTIPRGTGLPPTMPQIPPVTQGHHIPVNLGSIAAPPITNFEPNLPFMDCLKFPDWARLNNDPIIHQPHWPPIPTKLPSDVPNIEGKAGECP